MELKLLIAALVIAIMAYLAFITWLMNKADREAPKA